MSTNADGIITNDFIMEVMNSENYFTFYRAFTLIMPKMTALFYQDILNLACLKTAARERMEIDGRIFTKCTFRFMENSKIGWTEDEQRRHFKLLVKSGFVKTKRIGSLGCRYIYIDLVAANKAIQKVRELDGGGISQSGEKTRDSENQSRGKSRNQYRGKPHVKKEENTTYSLPYQNKETLSDETSDSGCVVPSGLNDRVVIPKGKCPPRHSHKEGSPQCDSEKGRIKIPAPSANQVTSPPKPIILKGKVEFPKKAGRFGLDKSPEVQELSSPYRKWTDRLYMMLKKHSCKPKMPKRWGDWDKHFRDLVNDPDGDQARTADEIDLMLDWYDVNLDKDYVGQYYCARTFCENFGRLEWNRRRLEKAEKEEKQKKEKMEREIANGTRKLSRDQQA